MYFHLKVKAFSAQNYTYKYNKLEALITTIETIRMYHLSFDFHF